MKDKNHLKMYNHFEVIFLSTSIVLKENEPQLVRKIYDKSKEYQDVVDLTLGDPDIPTPDAVKNAAADALYQNKTKYTANAGIPELRRAISEDVYKRTGLRYTENEIAVTAGAMGALYLTSVCILNPGDEAIILEPHWPNYTNMVKMCHATPRYVSFMGEGALESLTENIEKTINDKTKVIIINSQKYDLYVITDEVYRTIVFDGSFRSILELPDMKQRTILVDSLSKRFSMTGFRVGFVCAPEEIARGVATMQENVNSCACMFAQYASKLALEQSEVLERQICDTFRERCTAMTQELKKSDKLVLDPPTSTFYLFINIEKTGLGSEEFAYRLLEEKHIAVVPGNAFNRAGEGYIRIACTLGTEKLVAAAKQIVDFVENL